MSVIHCLRILGISFDLIMYKLISQSIISVTTIARMLPLASLSCTHAGRETDPESTSDLQVVHGH